VTGERLLRHCSLEAASLRDLDLRITPYDERRLAHLFRYDPLAIRKMTQSRGRSQPIELIATVRPMQVCRCCINRHWVEQVTRGARLRSWMEGWRISCPICGTAMEDARPLNLVTRADPAHPFLRRVAAHAQQGELMMTRANRVDGPTKPVVVLMRSLLLPRASRSREISFAGQTPRLLDRVVPGFDRFLLQSIPDFRRPGTLLLPISIRIPVLAGIARVASQPDRWAESLLDAAPKTARPGLAECFRRLIGAEACRQTNGRRAK
jgi:hypothetical protein